MSWFRRHLLLAKLVALALMAVPVAAATAGHGGGGAALDVRWDSARTAALRGTLVVPRAETGMHVVLAGKLDGDLELARDLRVVIVRAADGARLFDGSLASLAGLDLGATPDDRSQRELRYVVTLPQGAAVDALSATFRWADQPA
jgi:hypothetical protein